MARRLWSHDVETRWTPRPGLFAEDAETIAHEVLEGHGGDLAGSVASINFYVNRAGKNLTKKDRARLRHVLQIVEREGAPRGVGNPGIGNLDMILEMRAKRCFVGARNLIDLHDYHEARFQLGRADAYLDAFAEVAKVAVPPDVHGAMLEQVEGMRAQIAALRRSIEAKGR